MPGPIYSFGPFRYDATQRLLFRGNETVSLVPKALDTLHVLLEHRGRVIEKAELMKLVWPDTNVEEIGLARNISLLRKALGDEAETYIETIPRRGYRFIAETPEPDRPAARRPPLPRKWIAAATCVMALGILIYWQFYAPSRYLPRIPGVANLAVVPFECLGSTPPELSQEFNELLVAEISKLPSVQVMSPSTVRRYQRLGISAVIMARVLRLDVILEGTIHSTIGQNRITARLADVHSGKLIWAETYETGAGPGREVARAIATQAGARLSARWGKNAGGGPFRPPRRSYSTIYPPFGPLWQL